ncbi:hypothetical protein A3N43_24380 [Klebsiella aerogenes]|nr:hypothetical protein A3N43_24380 [Klebsiella aerogenes]
MQTIRFLPDRLNSEPVVFRGFTTHEMGLAALAGAGQRTTGETAQAGNNRLRMVHGIHLLT